MTTNEETTPDTSVEAQNNNVVPLPTMAEQPAHKKAVTFAREHPVMTIAGGLALGAIAAALIPSRNRRYIAKQSSLWTNAVTTAGAAIAQQAINHVDSARVSVRDSASSMASRAEHAGHAARNRMERAGHSTLGKAQSFLGRSRPKPTLSERIAEKAGRIMDRMHR